MAGLHVLGNFWKLGKFFKNLGTFRFWANFSKNWAKMNISWANFFPTHLNWPINLFSSLHDKNAVLHHLKFLRKFYPQKICPIHAVQPLLHHTLLTWSNKPCWSVKEANDTAPEQSHNNGRYIVKIIPLDFISCHMITQAASSFIFGGDSKRLVDGKGTKNVRLLHRSWAYTLFLQERTWTLTHHPLQSG